MKRFNYVTPEDFEIAEKNGICARVVSRRVRSFGWDVDRAITEPLKVEVPFQPIWNKWKSIAEKNGINYKLFYHRVRVRSYSEEEAATYPVDYTRVPQHIRKKRFEEVNG